VLQLTAGVLTHVPATHDQVLQKSLAGQTTGRVSQYSPADATAALQAVTLRMDGSVHTLKQYTGAHAVPAGHEEAVHCTHCAGSGDRGGLVQAPSDTRHRSCVHALPSLHSALCCADVSGTKPHAPLAHVGAWHGLVELGHTVYDGTHVPVDGDPALLTHVYDTHPSLAGHAPVRGAT
jgi:hypothetical protein